MNEAHLIKYENVGNDGPDLMSVEAVKTSRLQSLFGHQIASRGDIEAGHSQRVAVKEYRHLGRGR
jgi:hypothetical protein